MLLDMAQIGVLWRPAFFPGHVNQKRVASGVLIPSTSAAQVLFLKHKQFWTAVP